MKQGWLSFMDRRVKERLVGATILVVLVVLIVPELLSGPKRALVVPQAPPPGAAEPMRSVTVDLATNKATAATEEAAASPAGEAPGTNPGTTVGAAQSAGGDADGTSPESTAAGPAASGATPAVTAPATLRRGQPPVPPPLDNGTASPRSGQAAAKAEAVHHGWAAQLGSFAARANAEKLEQQLRTQGFSPFLVATGSGKTVRYRVRVGPAADRPATVKLIARLQKAGHLASVVAP